jgi:hypothetical protein
MLSVFQNYCNPQDAKSTLPDIQPDRSFDYRSAAVATRT